MIVAHGGLASEYVSAVEHVVGPQTGMIAVAIEPDHDRAQKQAEICHAAEAVDGGCGVVVVTDLFGGSPSNLSLMACAAKNRIILYGANLPMLVKLAKSRTRTLAEAVAAARDAGRRYINSFEITAEQPKANTSGAALPAKLSACAIKPIRAKEPASDLHKKKLIGSTGSPPSNSTISCVGKSAR